MLIRILLGIGIFIFVPLILALVAYIVTKIADFYDSLGGDGEGCCFGTVVIIMWAFLVWLIMSNINL